MMNNPCLYQPLRVCTCRFAEYLSSNQNLVTLSGSIIDQMLPWDRLVLRYAGIYLKTHNDCWNGITGFTCIHSTPLA